MVDGFMKGIWGRPATTGTGMMGLWGSITKAPKNIFGAIMTPFKILFYLIILIVGILLYSRLKK